MRSPERTFWEHIWPNSMLHLRSALLAVLVHSQAASCLVAAPAARVHRSVAPQLRHSVPIGIATMPAAEPIAPEDEWIAKVDIPAFKADIKALGDRLEKGQGDEDVAHLEKILRWSNICGGVGLLTCWMRPNPVSAPRRGLQYPRLRVHHRRRQYRRLPQSLPP